MAAIVIFVLLFVFLIAPTPHWKETSSQSCHLCGARRFIVSEFRWWTLQGTREESVEVFPVPEGHTHEWWEYSHTFISWSVKWAADKASVYKDGRITWTP